VSILSLVATFLLAELALRLLLFGGGDLARAWGAGLRRETLFAHWQSEDAYRLRALFDGEETGLRHTDFDSQLGWGAAERSRAARAAAEQPEGERPVLFYGDSYTACVREAGPCWEDLLESSELGRRFELTNLGVGGYGLDQIYLLLRETIDDVAHRDPLVLVGVLLDDDLDRVDLGLRRHPKPRFELAGDELRLHVVEHETAADYVAAHPPGIHSYLGRWFLHRSGLVPPRVRWELTGGADRIARLEALNRRLVEEIQAELVGRGLDSFFVLFHGKQAVQETGPYSWREPFLLRTLTELGIPFVSSKRALLEDAERTGRELRDYYRREDPGRNHYHGFANEAVFAAIRRGLEGEFDAPDGG
jgi:hypothetical protein